MLRTNKPRDQQTLQSASLRRAFTLIELLSVVAIIGLLAGVTAPPLFASITKARVARASGDLRSLAQDLAVIDSLPGTLAGIGRNDLLDPWGQPYVYLPFPEGGPLPGAARKDRFSVPINERFDIYSLGPNGASAPLLTAAASRDDVVAGNDGGFIGLAAKY